MSSLTEEFDAAFCKYARTLYLNKNAPEREEEVIVYLTDLSALVEKLRTYTGRRDVSGMRSMVEWLQTRAQTDFKWPERMLYSSIRGAGATTSRALPLHRPTEERLEYASLGGHVVITPDIVNRAKKAEEERQAREEEPRALEYGRLSQGVPRLSTKILVFDFDETLTKIHVFSKYTAQGKSQELQDMSENEMKNRLVCSAYNELKRAIQEWQKQGIIVAIASFGKKQDINAVVRKVYPMIAEADIFTPASVGKREGRSYDDKNDILAHIMQVHSGVRATNPEVMLVDDSETNIQGAINDGFKGYWIENTSKDANNIGITGNDLTTIKLNVMNDLPWTHHNRNQMRFWYS